MAQRSLREQLIDGAAKVLLERGFSAASVNDIVVAAGVPKGSFYNHFPSKEELAREVVRRYLAELALADLDRAKDSEDPIGELRAHFARVIAQRTAAGIEYGCLLGNFSTDVSTLSEALRLDVEAGFEQWASAVAVAIGRAQDLGRIATRHDPEVLARYVVAAFEGATARAKAMLDERPVAEFLDVTFGLLLA